MMKEIKKIFNIPIYGGKFIIVFTDEESPYNSAIRHFGYDNDDIKSCTAATLIHDKANSLYPVIFSKNIEDGTISHECFHVLNEIYKKKGITHDRDNDEPGAYLIGWLVDRVYEVKRKFDKLKQS